MGNADTVQQRGRFFGYKRDYLGLVRIFLEQTVAASFRNYVEHEKSVRRSLISYRDSGKSLSEWRRAFFLDRSMSPTRLSVLSLDYMRGRSREWVYAKQPHLGGVFARNTIAVDAFIAANAGQFVEDRGDSRRTAEQTHLVAKDVQLSKVYSDLLVPLSAVGDDLLDHLHVLLQIERELEEHPRAICDVYLMSKGAQRERGLDEHESIKNLMQGPNDRTGYPGDRQIREPNRVVVQIHKLNLKAESSEGGRKKAKVVAQGVPVVAVAIPEDMRRDALIEPSDG
jgi:hypothetical protein